MIEKIFPYFMVILAGLLTAAGNICLKLSRNLISNITFLESLFQPFFIAGIFCYAINVIIFSISLDRLQITVAYPLLTAVGYIALFLFSYFYIGEDITIFKVAGVLLILIGILILLSH